MNKLVIGAWLYVIIAIATFGNAGVWQKKQGEIALTECMTYFKDYTICHWYKPRGVETVISAVLWPFYWSYRIAEE